jgi:hypothetical protein
MRTFLLCVAAVTAFPSCDFGLGEEETGGWHDKSEVPDVIAPQDATKPEPIDFDWSTILKPEPIPPPPPAVPRCVDGYERVHLSAPEDIYPPEVLFCRPLPGTPEVAEPCEVYRVVARGLDGLVACQI